MKITVIGAAGGVGTSTVFSIAISRLADEIIMIGGKRQNLLIHHAMDFDTAFAADGVSVRAGGFEDMSGSDIVVNAAGIHLDVTASDRDERLRLNLPIIQDIAKNINRFCPEAVVITATNPIDPLNYAMYLLSPHRDRNRFIGYSRNDSSRFRIFVADTLGVKPGQVETMVIGEHGRTQVLLFSSIRVNGKPVNIDEATKKRIREQEPKLLHKFEELKAGRTTAWTTGVGLAEVCRAIIRDTGETVPCSAVLDGEYGYRGLSIGIPVKLGHGGIKEVLTWQLAPDELHELEVSVNSLKPVMQYVEQSLKKS